METKRLTNADLAEIKKRADYVIENAEWTSATISDLIEEDVPALLTEVERLRSVLICIDELSDEFYKIEVVDGRPMFALWPELENFRETIEGITFKSYEAVNEDD